MTYNLGNYADFFIFKSSNYHIFKSPKSRLRPFSHILQYDILLKYTER